MAVGPCGLEFREAFSCFHYSKSEVKGSECLEQFAKLQMCMKDFPELYEEKNKDGGETESSGDAKKEEEESTKDSPSSADSQAAKEEALRPLGRRPVVAHCRRGGVLRFWLCALLVQTILQTP